MNTSNLGISLIKYYEGFRAKAYLCPADVWTIGYGTTKGVKQGMIITEAQGEVFLQSDLKRFEAVVTKNVKVPLTQNQFDALVSFVYNVGDGNFLSSTLLRLLNQKKYGDVPAQFLRWNKAGGKVLNGLTKRRQSEATLFASGYVDVVK